MTLFCKFLPAKISKSMTVIREHPLSSKKRCDYLLDCQTRSVWHLCFANDNINNCTKQEIFFNSNSTVGIQNGKNVYQYFNNLETIQPQWLLCDFYLTDCTGWELFCDIIMSLGFWMGHRCITLIISGAWAFKIYVNIFFLVFFFFLICSIFLQPLLCTVVVLGVTLAPTL